MKILISAQVVWWNASAYYAITTAEALTKRNHEVAVLAHHSTPAFVQARARGLNVIGDLHLRSTNPIDLAAAQTHLRRLLFVEAFDVINPHRPEDHFHLALAKRLAGIKTPLLRTVSDVRAPRNNPLNRQLHVKQTQGYIYCAECCRQRYRATFPLDQHPDRVIYSALDVSRFTAGDWRQGNRFCDLPAPRVGIVARLSPNKGHRTLIAAAAQVRRAISNVHFLVVGKEEEVSIADLRAECERYNVQEAFTFTNVLDDPRSAIAACQVGVVASTGSEVISRACQEFFAFGVPVVATRLNVLPEMVREGVNGLIVPPGDAKALAEALVILLSSEEKLETMGRQAQETARQRHDLQALGRETEAFFEQFLYK